MRPWTPRLAVSPDTVGEQDNLGARRDVRGDWGQGTYYGGSFFGVFFFASSLKHRFQGAGFQRGPPAQALKLVRDKERPGGVQTPTLPLILTLKPLQSQSVAKATYRLKAHRTSTCLWFAPSACSGVGTFVVSRRGGDPYAIFCCCFHVLLPPLRLVAAICPGVAAAAACFRCRATSATSARRNHWGQRTLLRGRIKKILPFSDFYRTGV